MKRFASLITAAALAGSLVAAGSAARAASDIYLIPISDINATYSPGATVKFAAVVDLGSSSFAAISVPTAIAYITSEFGTAKPTAIYDASGDPTSPGSPLWNLTAPIYYSTTASAINGAKVLTIQPTVGHSATVGPTRLLPVPAGTYTIATFAFPIALTNVSGSATVSLPTPLGYSNSAFTTDGGYTPGVGPSFTIKGSDVNGVPLSDPLTFPDTGGKHRSLTFNVTHSEIYLVPISDINASYMPGSKVQVAAVVSLGSSAFAAFSVPAALAYTAAEFGTAKPTAIYDASGDPTSPGSPLWNLTAPIYYSTTASAINGAKVLTIQPTVGHSATVGPTRLLPVPAGTYTIATYTLPIAPSAVGSATVYLPTPFGYTNSAFTTDGGYTPGVGPSFTIKGSDVNGVPLSDPLTFPNSGGRYSSLTFKVIEAPTAMYLVPISDITATYAPGATVKFAAVMDVGSHAISALSVPTAIAYTSSDFGTAKPTAAYDATEDPLLPGSGQPFWDLTTPVDYATTASAINGAKVLTIQPTVGHSPVRSGNNTLAMPAGTYTIATFNFPIAPSANGSATVYLPTPFNFSSSALTTDGAYQIGVGPLLALTGKDVKGALVRVPLTFPNTGGKSQSLTFKVSGSGVFSALTGTLQFNDLVSTAAAQRVTFQFRDPATGAALFVQTANVPASGVFSLSSVPLQPYTLWIKPDKFLAHTVPVTVSGGAFVPIAQEFNGGDASNDNSVDTTDFGLLVGAYSSSATIPGSGYEVRADFNGDGFVNIVDFGILVDTYGQSGDL